MELRLISTTYEGKERITKEQTIPFCDDAGREDQLINLYPQVTYQRMDGFGGAITDSAAYIYSLMNPEQKKQMLGEYFGQGKMKYRFVYSRRQLRFFSLPLRSGWGRSRCVV